MELLRKVAGFTNIYMLYITLLYIRSILEQSSVVWHSSLTQDNSDDLERVQKAAVKIILGNKSESYEDTLIKVDLESLKERGASLTKNFANKCLKNQKAKKMFPMREKNHEMDVRSEEIFQVNFAKTERLKKSSIPTMQRILNNETKHIHEDQGGKKRKPG